MFRWLAGRGARPREVERELAHITNENWQTAVSRYAFLTGLTQQENDALRQRSAWLLASKTFSGAHGLMITDEIMLSVAIQAALPILQLDPAIYEGWTEIVIYPGGFLIPHTEVDENGVVHEYMAPSSGEAWDGGPVILSWEDTNDATDASNVVIHEFAHKLDLYGGDADGMPSLHAHPHLRSKTWKKILDASFQQFSDALTVVEDAIPRNVDPESDAAAPWLATLPLDPYAATDAAEFFAVSSEAFFVNPLPLSEALPDWYDLLAQYYQQDPLRRLAPQ